MVILDFCFLNTTKVCFLKLFDKKMFIYKSYLKINVIRPESVVFLNLTEIYPLTREI